MLFLLCSLILFGSGQQITTSRLIYPQFFRGIPLSKSSFAFLHSRTNRHFPFALSNSLIQLSPTKNN